MHLKSWASLPCSALPMARLEGIHGMDACAGIQGAGDCSKTGPYTHAQCLSFLRSADELEMKEDRHSEMARQSDTKYPLPRAMQPLTIATWSGPPGAAEPLRDDRSLVLYCLVLA